MTYYYHGNHELGNKNYYLNKVASLLSPPDKADVNYSSLSSSTPLMHALQTFSILSLDNFSEELAESSSIICYLLNHGAAPDTTDSSLNTPLHIACQSRYSCVSSEIIQTLINNHKNPKDAINALNTHNESPLMAAIKSGHEDLSLKRLFRHGGFLTPTDLSLLNRFKDTESYKSALSFMSKFKK